MRKSSIRIKNVKLLASGAWSGQTRQMLFRLTYAVRGYQLGYQDSIRVEVGGPHAFVVVLRQEPVEQPTPGEVILEITGDFGLTRRPAEALRDLAEGLLPADSIPEEEFAPEIKDRRLPESGRGLRFSELPNPLRDFIRNVTRELASTATEIFELIRWRRAMPGPVEALWVRRLEGIEWCDELGNWHRLPPDLQWLAGRARILACATPEEIADLQAMAASGIHEPLAHALLRQALRASGQREYASALVMAVTALEIGVKHLVGILIPSAEWLALHAPSPPVVEMLKDYLPTIRVHESIGGYVASPPAEILKTLKDAVYARNITVHRGPGKLKPDFIVRVLDAVADVLWMCDYFAGQKWAYRNMSEQMRSALPIPEAADSVSAVTESPDGAQGTG
jgi:HEPN domain-containing protein